MIDPYTGRKPVAEALGWVANYRPPDPGSSVPVDEPPPYGADLRAWPTARELAPFWGQLTATRNLINHAAMRKNWHDIKSGKVVEQIRALYEQLRHLAQPLMEADQ